MFRESARRVAIAATAVVALTAFSGAPAHAAKAAAPTVNFTVDSAKITLGTETRLRWSTKNAKSCRSSNGWGGSRPLKGVYRTNAIKKGRTYVLACTGPGGTTTKSVKVTVVKPAAAKPTPKPAPKPSSKPKTGAPTVTFTADAARIRLGTETKLRWTAQNAEFCRSSDGWGGRRPVKGIYNTNKIKNDRNYVLTCTGPGGSTVKSVRVDVVKGAQASAPKQKPTPKPTPKPDPKPTLTSKPNPSVKLSIDRTTVMTGQKVTLTWSSTDSKRCVASGAWSGAKAVKGSITVGPLTQRSTFTLSCGRDGATAMAMGTVTVNGKVTLAWVPPTQNVDGSPLKNLAGYRLHYGEVSGKYTTKIQLPKDRKQHTLTLPVGEDHVFAMTAYTSDGKESSFSGEVKRRAR